MNQQDDQLRTRLREWRGLEPRADFEAEVWRRVAASAVPGVEWFVALREWFGVRPLLANAAAVLLAVAVGIGSLLAVAQPQREVFTMNLPTLHGQTLAGNYLAMTSGGMR
jgi:negative regulator of sigma E activity